ncbi:MAG: GWxTD domain-containing protein [Thermoanaerobaculia bacterium]
MIRRTSILVLTLAVLAGAAHASSLPEMFKNAKDEFGHGEYVKSLADFQILESVSRQPGNEADRVKLAPIITFYRAANLAALGRKNESRDLFVAFLTMKPDASITTPPFQKEVVAAFQDAQKTVQGGAISLAAQYAMFEPPRGWSLPADEHWGDSPVRYLLTSSEKSQYAALTSGDQRQAFVNAFWSGLDPTPGTAENELRREFDRRVAFANAAFATEKVPGAQSDRATVFAFLGAPSFMAMKAVENAGDDAMDALRRGGRASSSAAHSLDATLSSTSRMSWVYRKDRIPESIPFPELRFDFVTRPGYGTAVLQKDDQPMQALGRAAALTREKKQLN